MTITKPTADEFALFAKLPEDEQSHLYGVMTRILSMNQRLRVDGLRIMNAMHLMRKRQHTDRKLKAIIEIIGTQLFWMAVRFLVNWLIEKYRDTKLMTAMPTNFFAQEF